MFICRVFFPQFASVNTKIPFKMAFFKTFTHLSVKKKILHDRSLIGRIFIQCRPITACLWESPLKLKSALLIPQRTWKHISPLLSPVKVSQKHHNSSMAYGMLPRNVYLKLNNIFWRDYILDPDFPSVAIILYWGSYVPHESRKVNAPCIFNPGLCGRSPVYGIQ